MITETFPLSTYALMPDLFKRICKPLQQGSQKDIMLLSALAAMSACFPTVKAVYDGEEVYSNMYCLILAPPARGKSIAKHAVTITSKIHEYLESNMTGEGTIKAHRLYLPADSTAAFLLKHIKENELHGNFIFDSEADTLGTLVSHDHGRGLSELYRKAFHHEDVLMGRATENLLIVINSPKISLLLTGTPDQLMGIVKSFEDGLMSRFLIYNFDTELVWRDVSNTRGINYKQFYSSFSDELLEIYRYFIERDFEFTLDDKGWSYFNQRSKFLLKSLVEEHGSGVEAIALRSNFNAFRIAMVFGIVEHYAKKLNSNTIVATQDILAAAMNVTALCARKTCEIYANSRVDTPAYDRLLQFVNELPGSFRRAEAINVGENIGIKSRTVATYLKEAILKGYLVQTDHGGYERVSKD